MILFLLPLSGFRLQKLEVFFVVIICPYLLLCWWWVGFLSTLPSTSRFRNILFFSFPFFLLDRPPACAASSVRFFFWHSLSPFWTPPEHASAPFPRLQAHQEWAVERLPSRCFLPPLIPVDNSTLFGSRRSFIPLSNIASPVRPVLWRDFALCNAPPSGDRLIYHAFFCVPSRGTPSRRPMFFFFLVHSNPLFPGYMPALLRLAGARYCLFVDVHDLVFVIGRMPPAVSERVPFSLSGVERHPFRLIPFLSSLGARIGDEVYRVSCFIDTWSFAANAPPPPPFPLMTREFILDPRPSLSLVSTGEPLKQVSS